MIGDIELALLALLVLSCWLRCAGMLRMREPTQALHYLSLPAGIGAVILPFAMFCATGWSIPTLKAASSRHLVHTVISLAVLQTSTYVLLLSIGYRIHGAAPIFADISPGVTTVDPVVQALMLTDVVVEATVMALLLAMVVKAHEKAGTLSPDDLRVMRG